MASIREWKTSGGGNLIGAEVRTNKALRDCNFTVTIERNFIKKSQNKSADFPACLDGGGRSCLLYN